MNKQHTLSTLTDELGQAATHKKKFLRQIDRIIPWSEWKGIIEPYYCKGERGNKLFDLELMLRIHPVQSLYMAGGLDVCYFSSGLCISTVRAAHLNEKQVIYWGKY